MYGTVPVPALHASMWEMQSLICKGFPQEGFYLRQLLHFQLDSYGFEGGRCLIMVKGLLYMKVITPPKDITVTSVSPNPYPCNMCVHTVLCIDQYLLLLCDNLSQVLQ